MPVSGSTSGFLRRRTPVAFAALAAAALVATGTSGTAGAAAKPAAKPAKPPITQAVQLLSFNDYHGHIQPDAGTSTDGSVRNESGTPVPAGGAAYLTTHLNALRAGHANSLTVAAGDLIGGSTFESGVF